ncbi:hypothetical protein FLA105534_01558 [Flavobacterium bizetiae]|uniref:Uncharacterized protein n=1 Tax=Flavobacterium bizetiae TaxID=2704140 RepID=A0A6J4GDJ1_9FLAO|nr:hypothetical protein FLA105534_01558 [Flavobacterium bizetiae]CAD5342582.1 hypothetical protein FLA105535_02570 [Flavobacterium bizetiae]CAD5348117.1 hypothetical protein FLA105534_02076 [Flavobacterium bizetiae]
MPGQFYSSNKSKSISIVSKGYPVASCFWQLYPKMKYLMNVPTYFIILLFL